MRHAVPIYPKQELKSAVELLQAFAANRATQLSWQDLAQHMELNYEGGGFRKRNQAARDFGLITFASGRSKLTALGQLLIENNFEPEYLQRAFRHVGIFRRLFSEFRGEKIPPLDSIVTELRTLGVPQIEDEKIKNVFLRSAKLAGLIDEEGRIMQKRDSNGLIPVIQPLTYRPAIMPTPLTRPMDLDKAAPSVAATDDEVSPALMSLIKRLPPLGEKIGPKRRKHIIEAFTSTINFLYPEEEE